PHDARVGEQASNVALAEASDARVVEVGKGGPECLALAQDRQPRQPGLEALQAELLEQPRVVGDGEAPFAVVVRAVLPSGLRPPASRQAILTGEQTVLGHCAAPDYRVALSPATRRQPASSAADPPRPSRRARRSSGSSR